jgi:HTH-type transcriptional regulator/antitoxin HigA
MSSTSTQIGSVEKADLAPGSFIRAELNKRGWTQEDLARITNKPLRTINRIIQGKHAIIPEMAVALGTAFGDGAEVWMRRETSYRLSQVKPTDPDVRRLAEIYQRAPVKDMEKRGWIQKADSVDQLERELSAFFETDSFLGELELSASARSSLQSPVLTASQRAWCYRAKHLARTMPAAPFNGADLEEGSKEISKLAAFPEQVRQIPKLLSQLGIRFVVVEHLPQSKIDGAAIWIDPATPVIALSVRYDRIDCFWHTLCHEIAHIRYRDSFSMDEELVGESKRPDISYNEIEARADFEAADMLIPRDRLRSFIVRQKPIYSKSRIIQFAHRIKIHPGIITGQLQSLGELTWNTNREMLVKIRHLITKAALTDGWGYSLPAT